VAGIRLGASHHGVRLQVCRRSLAGTQGAMTITLPLLALGTGLGIVGLIILIVIIILVLRIL
jgi:hypothetical protein